MRKTERSERITIPSFLLNTETVRGKVSGSPFGASELVTCELTNGRKEKHIDFDRRSAWTGTRLKRTKKCVDDSGGIHLRKIIHGTRIFLNRGDNSY